MAEGEDKIRQNVRLILGTRLGERPMLRDFGTRMPGLVHDPNDEVLRRHRAEPGARGAAALGAAHPRHRLRRSSGSPDDGLLRAPAALRPHERAGGGQRRPADSPEETRGGPRSDTPAIDYTDKDFASLRQALLDLAAYRLPEWTDRSRGRPRRAARRPVRLHRRRRHLLPGPDRERVVPRHRGRAAQRHAPAAADRLRARAAAGGQRRAHARPSTPARHRASRPRHGPGRRGVRHHGGRGDARRRRSCTSAPDRTLDLAGPTSLRRRRQARARRPPRAARPSRGRRGARLADRRAEPALPAGRRARSCSTRLRVAVDEGAGPVTWDAARRTCSTTPTPAGDLERSGAERTATTSSSSTRTGAPGSSSATASTAAARRSGATTSAPRTSIGGGAAGNVPAGRDQPRRRRAIAGSCAVTNPLPAVGRRGRRAGRARRPLRAARVPLGRPRGDAQRLRGARAAGRRRGEGARAHDRLEPRRPLRRARRRARAARRPTSSSGASSRTSRPAHGRHVGAHPGSASACRSTSPSRSCPSTTTSPRTSVPARRAGRRRACSPSATSTSAGRCTSPRSTRRSRRSTACTRRPSRASGASDQAPPRTLRRKVLLDAGLGAVSDLVRTGLQRRDRRRGTDRHRRARAARARARSTVTVERRARREDRGVHAPTADIVGRRVQRVLGACVLDDGDAAGAPRRCACGASSATSSSPTRRGPRPVPRLRQRGVPAGGATRHGDRPRRARRRAATDTGSRPRSPCPAPVDGVAGRGAAADADRRRSTATGRPIARPRGDPRRRRPAGGPRARHDVLLRARRRRRCRPATRTLPRRRRRPTEVHRSGRMLYELLPAILRRHDVIDARPRARHGRDPGGARPTTGSCAASSTSSAPASDHLRSRADGLRDLHDVDAVDYRMLPHLAAMARLGPEPRHADPGAAARDQVRRARSTASPARCPAR